MRTSRSGRWAASTASIVAVGLVVLATSIVVSAGEAGGAPAATSITGACTLPGGATAPVSAAVAATFPQSQPTGQSLPATNVSVTLTLSPQLVAGLRSAGGTNVTGGVSADLKATNGTTTQELALTKLTTPDMALPATGSLLLTATGVLPVVTPAQPGTLNLNVDTVMPSLTITGGSVTTACSTQVPPADELASVSVVGPAAAVEAPADTTTTTPPPAAAPSPDLFVSYTLAGETTLKKLKSSVLVKGELDTTINLLTGQLTGTITIDPAPGTFLGFGVVPVSATTHFVEATPVSGVFQNGDVNASVGLRLLLQDSSVNGTPLTTLGNNCEAIQPLEVHIEGPLNLLGTTNFLSLVTVSNFEGCGTTENLNPLFDGLVSGPDNPLATTLTLRCSSGTDPNCGPNGAA